MAVTAGTVPPLHRSTAATLVRPGCGRRRCHLACGGPSDRAATPRRSLCWMPSPTRTARSTGARCFMPLMRISIAKRRASSFTHLSHEGSFSLTLRGNSFASLLTAFSHTSSSLIVQLPRRGDPDGRHRHLRLFTPRGRAPRKGASREGAAPARGRPREARG